MQLINQQANSNTLGSNSLEPKNFASANLHSPHLHLVTLNKVNLMLAEQSILKNVSFNINTGDKIALLGDSGVGKSSLLKLIARVHKPTSGVFSNKAKRIGYVFQEPRLLPWLTVEQNIVEAMKAHSISTNQIPQKLNALLNQVELAPYKKHFPHQLSGGMAQRVSLARAFAISPDLLLLDEPFSALDSTLVKQLSQLLSRFLNDKITMVYVSHHIEQVLPLTTSCLLFQYNPKIQAQEITRYDTANNSERQCFLEKFYQTSKLS